MFRCFGLGGCGGSVEVVDKRHCSLMSVPDEVVRNSRTLEECFLDANQISELPKKFFNLTKLRTLTLSDNDLKRLPANLGNLMQLCELDVSRNDIDELPDNIKFCENLRTLDLSSNPIQRLPDGFCQLRMLTVLNLNDISLGELPADVGNLSNLNRLECRDNMLANLPLSFARLSKLEFLDLGGNAFKDLPPHVGDLTHLSDLFLDGNELTSLPEQIGGLQRLNQLDVSENYLEYLPEDIGGLSSLNDLTLSQNNLDALPDGIGKLGKLAILKVDQNRLVSLTPRIGECKALSELLLTENLLSYIPPSLGNLRLLINLNVDRNRLVELPRELGQCEKLSILSVRDNRLRRLPKELGELNQLRILDAAGNKLDRLPANLKYCHLKALWLSENQAQPTLRLQTDRDEETGEEFLTCYLLPQDGFETASMENYLEPSKLEDSNQDMNTTTNGPSVMEEYDPKLRRTSSSPKSDHAAVRVRFGGDLRDSGAGDTGMDSGDESREPSKTFPKEPVHKRHSKLDRRSVDGHVIPKKPDGNAAPLFFQPHRVPESNFLPPATDAPPAPVAPNVVQPVSQGVVSTPPAPQPAAEESSSSSSDSEDSSSESSGEEEGKVEVTVNNNAKPFDLHSAVLEKQQKKPSDPPQVTVTAASPAKKISSQSNDTTTATQKVVSVTTDPKIPTKASAEEDDVSSSSDSDDSSSSSEESSSESESAPPPPPVPPPVAHISAPKREEEVGQRHSRGEEDGLSSGGEEIDYQFRHVGFSDDVKEEEADEDKTPKLFRRDTPHYNKNAKIHKPSDPQFVVKVIEKYKSQQQQQQHMSGDSERISPVVTVGAAIRRKSSSGSPPVPRSSFVSPPATSPQQNQQQVADMIIQPVVNRVDWEAPPTANRISFESTTTTTTTTNGTGDGVQTLVITIHKTPGVGLGISIAGGHGSAPYRGDDNGIFISRAAEDKPAYHAGLRKGDKLLSVNGLGMVDVPHSAAVDALRNAKTEIRLEVQREVEHHVPSPTTNSFHEAAASEPIHVKQETINCVVHKDENGLGFSIAGGKDSLPRSLHDERWAFLEYVYISKISDNGAAERTGMLQVGDRLMKVNGVDVSEARHDQVVSMLKSSDNDVILEVLREHVAPPSTSPPSYDDAAAMPAPDLRDEEAIDVWSRNLILKDREELIKIMKTGGPLGLSICGGSDHSSHPFGTKEPGVFISKIVPTGAASRTSLRIGDRILAVNGRDVTKCSHTETVHALVQPPNTIALHIRHDSPPPGLQAVSFMRRPGEKLGLSIRGGVGGPASNPDDPTDEGVFVTGVASDSAANRVGSQLHIGTRLLEVNGNSLLGVSQAEAVRLLRELGLENTNQEINLLVCDGWDEKRMRPRLSSSTSVDREEEVRNLAEQEREQRETSYPSRVPNR